MRRLEHRTLKESEKEPFLELLKVQKHYFKDFDSMLKNIKDPRHQSYTTYGIDQIIYLPLMKCIFNLKSMQQMTNKFNTNTSIQNFGFLGNKELDEIPHYVTVNECLANLKVEELEKIRTKMVKSLIRKRSFEDSRFLGKYWVIIVDATQTFHFKEKHCDHCLTKTHTNKETGEKTTSYHHNVLEAKIVLADNLVVSIATEFIENNGEDAKRQENMSEEEKKQDCETKAFKRLEKKLKAAFGRLPICIMGDSLYASEPVFQICDKNDWKYMIRFKDGKIKSISSEFHLLKDREPENQKDEMKWVNDIAYNQRAVNVLEFLLDKKDKTTTFQWITNVAITRKKCKELAETGRKRWKIENEGFNIQKNYRYDIKHANSLNYNAMKNHYLLVQIADIILQLYEKTTEIIKKLKKTIKNISSDLLKSFQQHALTREDIPYLKKRTSFSIPR